MDPGQLRHRVAFLAPTEGKNRLGEDVPAWSVVRDCWALLTPVSSRELYAAQQSQPALTYRLTCRWFAGLQPTWQVRYQGRLLHILGSPRDLDGRHQWWEIDLQEVS